MAAFQWKKNLGSCVAIIAGVDEAGRGPLAGPVVAAAVILDASKPVIGLADSKKLSAKKRESLYYEIMEKADVGVGVCGLQEIEENNILLATQKAMYQSLGQLSNRPTQALIDGHELPSQMIPNEGVIGGDDTVDCIQAASIVAKVTRDRMMEQYDIIFPGYGFAKHKGYGTASHIEKLIAKKACLIHRKTFNPVKDHLPTIKWLKENRKIGQWGEQLSALKFLDQGNKINAMNVHCAPHGEIDIIAESEDELIFTEVKTSASKTMGSVEEKVDVTKLNKLSAAIDTYLMDSDIEKDIRIDVFAVQIKNTGPKLKHFKGIILE